MRFANPEILWALLLTPLLAAFLWWSQNRRRRILERFAAAETLAFLTGRLSDARRLFKYLLLLLAVTGIIFAAARPQWGYEDRTIISRGLDIIVAVDTSTSMLAQDYKPSRLERARELLQNILWKAKGDRLGVIAFAGRAFVATPLTLDYSMAKTALSTLNVNTVPARGTALGEAIRAAIGAFETGSRGARILILLTDGEDQGSQPIEAAQEAAKADIKIYTIGIGTTQGMPIPIGNGYKQDRSGSVVNTRLDFATLSRIAEITGGKAIKANQRGTAELDVILADIDRLQRVEQQDRVYRVYTEQFQWFLLPAILLLIWEAWETGYSRRGRTWKGRVVEA